MLKPTYDYESALYIQQRLREEAHRELIREASRDRKPVARPLLARLGRVLIGFGARLQQADAPRDLTEYVEPLPGR